VTVISLAGLSRCICHIICSSTVLYVIRVLAGWLATAMCTCRSHSSHVNCRSSVFTSALLLAPSQLRPYTRPSSNSIFLVIFRSFCCADADPCSSGSAPSQSAVQVFGTRFPHTSESFILLRLFAKLLRLICFCNYRHCNALSVDLR